jgi:hypothetical protein
MEKAHLKSIIISVFVAVTVISAGSASWAFGASYNLIDLTPAGFGDSRALGACGTQQVGIGDNHALLWNGSAASYIDLNPGGYNSSVAAAISGTQQVGYGSGPATNNETHAVLWNGTSGSFIDLNPSGYSNSYATGTNGAQQVGYRTFPNRALLWSGTPGSCVSLQPSGFTGSSKATGISGTQQVGFLTSSAWGGPYGSAGTHACLWNGTAASCLDLHPAGYAWSEALGTSSTQQVGRGFISDLNYHALLWSGSAESCIDLNPAGFTKSEALGTNGTQQVGWGVRNGENLMCPMLWNGSAVDFVTLPLSGLDQAWATGIDESGNIVGVGLDISGSEHALLWAPIPEPASLLLLSLGAIFLRKHKN